MSLLPVPRGGADLHERRLERLREALGRQAAEDLLQVDEPLDHLSGWVCSGKARACYCSVSRYCTISGRASG